MLYEVLLHAINLDIGWFVPFIMNNLLWVFLLACIGHFIYGKGPIVGAAFVAIYLYATFDFGTALGWVFMSGIFWAPMLVLLAKIAYDAFFGKEGFKRLPLPWFASLVFYLGLFFINVVIS